MKPDDPRIHQAEEYHRVTEGWDPGDAMVRSYTYRGETTHWVRLEDVAALVKAARAAIEQPAIAGDQPADLLEAFAEQRRRFEALSEALKPFE